MELKEHAELVRLARLDLKQRRTRGHSSGNALFGSETSEDYIRRTASGSDSSYAFAARNWDRQRASAPKDVRRRTRNAAHFDGGYGYGYHGLTARPVRGAGRVNKTPSSERVDDSRSPKRRLRNYGSGRYDAGFLTD